ncbi:MAG: ferredoxin, partial [Planctomycetota bacterium]
APPCLAPVDFVLAPYRRASAVSTGSVYVCLSVRQTETMPAPPVELETLPRSEKHRPRGEPTKSKRTRWRVLTWVLVHLAVLVHIAHWQITGSSLTPLEPSEAGEIVTLGYVNAGFILFAISILATLIFGRFFCGWACHVVAYQDACAFLLKKLGIHPRPIRSRLLVFVPFIAAADMFIAPALARFLADTGFPELALHLTTDDLWARFPGPFIAILTFVVDGFLIVYLFGAKSFCTYGCPYGAIFGIADRVAPGRIRVTDACEGCGHCTATCTSNVRVHEEVARFKMVVDAGCMKCLDCVSVCPKNALYFGFGAAPNVKPKRGRSKRQYDFSWPEEIAAAAVFAASLWSWRGLYGHIPFLLAIGLAVFAGIATIVLWRMATNGSFRFQNWALRSNGRLSKAGGSVVCGFGSLLLLTAHSGLVQYHDREAEGNLTIAETIQEPIERSAVITEAEAHLNWLRTYALVSTADLHNKLGSIYWSRGERGRAEEAMRAAVELDADFSSSWLVLADIAMLEGDQTEALDALESVLLVEPTSSDVGRRLEGLLKQNAAQSARPALMLTSILINLERSQDAAGLLDSIEQQYGSSQELLDYRARLNPSE